MRMVRPARLSQPLSIARLAKGNPVMEEVTYYRKTYADTDLDNDRIPPRQINQYG
jgi:hypothetical protein